MRGPLIDFVVLIRIAANGNFNGLFNNFADIVDDKLGLKTEKLWDNLNLYKISMYFLGNKVEES